MTQWLLLSLLALALPVRAELWGYVDGSGVAHFAPRQLDARYSPVLGGAGMLGVVALVGALGGPPGVSVAAVATSALLSLSFSGATLWGHAATARFASRRLWNGKGTPLLPGI